MREMGGKGAQTGHDAYTGAVYLCAVLEQSQCCVAVIMVVVESCH